MSRRLQLAQAIAAASSLVSLAVFGYEPETLVLAAIAASLAAAPYIAQRVSLRRSRVAVKL